MPSLQARLHERKIHPERREKNWIFINSIVHDRYNELCEMFGLNHQDKQENKEKLHKEIELILKKMSNEITQPFWITIYRWTEEEMKNSTKPIIKLWWAEFWVLSPEMYKKDIKNELIDKKRGQLKRNVFKLLFWAKKSEIQISQEEIEEVYNNMELTHVLDLTEEWKNVLNSYLESKWDNLEKLRKRKRENVRWLLWNCWGSIIWD